MNTELRKFHVNELRLLANDLTKIRPSWVLTIQMLRDAADEFERLVEDEVLLERAMEDGSVEIVVRQCLDDGVNIQASHNGSLSISPDEVLSRLRERKAR